MTFIFNGRKCFNLFNIPIIFKHLIEIFFMTAPAKRLKFWTLSILVSSILSRKGKHFLFLNLCIMYLDFFIFKDSLLSLLIFSNSFTLFNYVFKCCSIFLVRV